MTDTTSLATIIDNAWENRAEISLATKGEIRDAVNEALALLDSGRARVAEPHQGGAVTEWRVNQWLKKAVLLSFRLNDNRLIEGANGPWCDKVETKFSGWTAEDFRKAGFRLGEQHNRRLGRLWVGKDEIPVAIGPARDLEIDHAILDPVHAHQLAVAIQQVVECSGFLHVQLVQGTLKPHTVTLEVDQLAAKHGCHLIDAIGHQKAAIKDRHLGFGLGKVFSVHIDSTHDLVSWCCGCRGSAPKVRFRRVHPGIIE